MGRGRITDLAAMMRRRHTGLDSVVARMLTPGIRSQCHKGMVMEPEPVHLVTVSLRQVMVILIPAMGDRVTAIPATASLRDMVSACRVQILRLMNPVVRHRVGDFQAMAHRDMAQVHPVMVDLAWGAERRPSGHRG